MFKKTSRTLAPSVIPMTTDNSNVVPMEVDNSKVVPMTVDESNTIPMEVQSGVYEVTENITRKKGDLVKFEGLEYRIVEVIDNDRYHLKNTVAPFNSFIAVSNELE